MPVSDGALLAFFSARVVVANLASYPLPKAIMKLSFSYPSILNILLRKPSDEIHSNNRKELCFFFSLPFLFPRAVIPIIYPTLQDRLSNNISCHQLLKARNTTKPFYTMLFSAITKYTEKRLFNIFLLQIQMQIYFTTVLFLHI